MNRLLTVVLFYFTIFFGYSQVAFTVISPASIAGGYEFTSNGDAPNWGLANLNNPLDAIQDTVVIYDDGTAGLNAQGIPHANEGCAPSIIDLTGKIALIYRYDGVSTNSCYAGTKVLNAQNAGAIGVILVNREDGVYGYDGTADGPLTNIPFAFIGKTDGALIRSKIEAGEDVVAFIGNKLGLYSNDIGIVRVNTLAPKLASNVVLNALSPTEFNFDLGTTIYNYGANAQSDVMLTTTVNGPTGNWVEVVGPFTIPSGDSVEIVTGGANPIPTFSFANYPVGNYLLNYEISMSNSDESSFDNLLTYNFVINDSVISYAKTDPVSNLPIPNTFTRSTASNFSACMMYQNANAGRIGATGIYFATEPGYATGAILEGENFGVSMYEWNDGFSDLNDPNFGFNDLIEVASGEYYFGPNLEGEMVFAPFSEPIQLVDNQRYLACVEVYNDNFWIGFNNRVDYTKNIDYYLQPLAPVASNFTYYALGFGEHMVPAIGLRVIDANYLSLESRENGYFSISPNPSSNRIKLNSESNIKNVQVMDCLGRIVLDENLSNGSNSLFVGSLETGNYMVIATDENGIKSAEKLMKF